MFPFVGTYNEILTIPWFGKSQLTDGAPNPESLKNTVKSRVLGFDIAAVRPQCYTPRPAVQQALIYQKTLESQRFQGCHFILIVLTSYLMILHLLKICYALSIIAGRIFSLEVWSWLLR